MTPTGRLRADGARLGYSDRIISSCLDLVIPDAEFTAVMRPNSYGKSALLRALTRLLGSTAKRVILDGRDIHNQPTRQVARRIDIPPQSSMVPDGIAISGLMARGESPHQGFAHRWILRDEELVVRIVDGANVTTLTTRRVDELSGRQRQWAQIAMAPVQNTPVLLLDKPTTFFNIRRQVKLMEFLVGPNWKGRCLVAVLHNPNQAARFSTHLIVMRAGRIIAWEPPGEMMIPGLVEEVFRLSCVVAPDPVTRFPRVTPIGRITPLNHEGPV